MSYPIWIQGIERQTQTWFFQWRGPIIPPENLVILAIDEESLSQGQHYNPITHPDLAGIASWPFTRSAYGEVIARLMASGATAVGLDLILDSPSVYGELDDRRLQQVLQRYEGEVAIAAVYEESSAVQGVQIQFSPPHPHLHTPSMVWGFINYLPEANGRIHRLAEFYQKQFQELVGLDFLVPSFAQATAIAAGGDRPDFVGEEIFYYGPAKTFTMIPFYHVLDRKNWSGYLQNGAYFRDKIVLIGPTAASLQDLHRTPFSGTGTYPHLMSGVEIHANAIATRLTGTVIRDHLPHPWQRGIWVGTLSTSVGLMLWLLSPPPLLRGVAGAIGAIGLTSLGFIAFTQLGIIVPIALPALSLVSLGMADLIVGAIGDRLSHYRLRRTLERYLAQPIVQEILKHPESYHTLRQGQRVKAAILFSDLRDFSVLSTQLVPEELVDQLNTYLDRMVSPILAFRGTLDKFIGDAVMAEFGSPVSYGAETDAMNAIFAALGMRKNLMELRQQWEQQGKSLFFNGIGIHYGEMIAGDIGSAARREYAVIGDAVNLASRVEGLTKNFVTDILITEAVYELVKDRVEAIDLQEHQVKGREEKVRIYALVGLKGEGDREYQAVRQAFLKFLYS